MAGKAGYLDVKYATRRGIQRKPWKRRWVILSKMTDLDCSVVTKLTMFLDQACAELGSSSSSLPRSAGSSFSSSRDKHTVYLEDITHIKRSKSRTHMYAFEIACNGLARISLAGESETESQAWMEALRCIFSPRPSTPHALMHREYYHVAIIDNDSSTSLALSGDYYMTVTTSSVTLRRPLDGTLVHEWLLNTLARFYVPSTSSKLDENKIFVIVAGQPGQVASIPFIFFTPDAGVLLKAVHDVVHEVVQEVRSRQGSVGVAKSTIEEEEYDEIIDEKVMASPDMRRNSADSVLPEAEQIAVRRVSKKKDKRGIHNRRHSLPGSIDICAEELPSAGPSIEHLASSYPNPPNDNATNGGDTEMKFAKGLYLSSSPPAGGAENGGNFPRDFRSYEESFITDDYDTFPGQVLEEEQDDSDEKTRTASVSTSSSRDSGVHIVGWAGPAPKPESTASTDTRQRTLTNSTKTRSIDDTIDEEEETNKFIFSHEAKLENTGFDIQRQRSRTDPCPEESERPFMIPRSMSSVENLLQMRKNRLESNEERRKISTASNASYVELDVFYDDNQENKIQPTHLVKAENISDTHKPPLLPPQRQRAVSDSGKAFHRSRLRRQDALHKSETQKDSGQEKYISTEEDDIRKNMRYRSSRDIQRPTVPPPKPPQTSNGAHAHGRSRSLPEDGAWLSIEDVQSYKNKIPTTIPQSPVLDKPRNSIFGCSTISPGSDHERQHSHVGENVDHIAPGPSPSPPPLPSSDPPPLSSSPPFTAPAKTSPRPDPFTFRSTSQRSSDDSMLSPLSPPPPPLLTSSPASPLPPFPITHSTQRELNKRPSMPIDRAQLDFMPNGTNNDGLGAGYSEEGPKKRLSAFRIKPASKGDDILHRQNSRESLRKLNRNMSTGSNVYYDLDMLDLENNPDIKGTENDPDIKVTEIAVNHNTAPEPPPRRKNASTLGHAQRLDGNHKNLHDFLGLPLNFDEHPPSLPERPKSLLSVTKRVPEGRKSLRRVVMSHLTRKKSPIRQTRESVGDSSEGSLSEDETETATPRSVTTVKSWPLVMREKVKPKKTKQTKRKSREMENDLYSRSPFTMSIADLSAEELRDLESGSDSSSELSQTFLQVPSLSGQGIEKITPPPFDSLLRPPPSPLLNSRFHRQSDSPSSDQSQTSPTPGSCPDAPPTKTQSAAQVTYSNLPYQHSRKSASLSQQSAGLTTHAGHLQSEIKLKEAEYVNVVQAGASTETPIPVYNIDPPADMFSIRTKGKHGESVYINFNVKDMSLSIQNEDNYMQTTSHMRSAESCPNINRLSLSQIQVNQVGDRKLSADDCYMSMSDISSQRPTSDTRKISLNNSQQVVPPTGRRESDLYMTIGQLKLCDPEANDVYV